MAVDDREVSPVDDERVGDGPERYRRIAVPIDDPRTAPLFVSIARSMLDPVEGRLLVMTVVTDEAQAESSADTVAEVCDALDASFGPEHGIEVQRRNAPSVARGILDFAREQNPDLVVMGMQVAADGERFSAVADAVIEAVHCSVLAIRPSEAIGIERVLVGIDGSDEALAALEVAVLVSDGMSVPLTVVHVRNPALSRTYAASVLAEAADTVPDWLDADGHVIDATHPGQGLVAQSLPTDLVFLAAAHRRGIARVASGGTLEQTIRYDQAHVAVLANGSKGSRTRASRLRAWIRSLHPRLTPLERESVQWRSGANAPLTTDYMILLAVSGLLASFGLLQDSVAVVIGAMLVAPLLGPLSAASTALVTARVDVLGRSVFTLLAGTFGTVVVALAVGAAIPIDAPTSEMLARGSPTLVDLGVAISAGVVGAYATARKDIPAALAGVAIAAALVPPICTTGLALGLGDVDLAAGSLLLFTVNSISVVMIGAVVLWWMGLRPSNGGHRSTSWLMAVTATVLAFVIVVAGLNSFQDARRESIAADDVRDLFPQAEVVDVETEGEDPVVVTAVLRTAEILDESVVGDAERRLRDGLGRDVELRVVEQRVVTGG